MKKPLITVRVWTERFLGTTEMASAFLSMIKALDGGKWTPDKWSQFEPIKNAFTPGSEERLLCEWVEARHGRVSNCMYFTRKKPSLLLGVTSWRGRVPDLNDVWFDIEAKEFNGAEGVTRLKRIVGDFISWSGAVYATAEHSGQRRYRSVPGNPAQRLDQLNWLTFLGPPYLKLFGEEHIKKCPFYSSETLGNGLLLTAAERADSPTMLESSDVLISLEKCLGADAFATEDYPEVLCRVPSFNLSETINPENNVRG